MLKAADYFFMILHSALVLFNLAGWAFVKTRKLHLITIVLTGLSWVVLGFWKGLGYCPLTDWHWKILVKLGKKDLPDSYMKFLVDRILGTDVDPRLTDISTVSVYILLLIMTFYMNFGRKLEKRKD